MHATNGPRASMLPETLPRDLSELIVRVQALPEEHRRDLEPCLERVVEFTRRRRRLMREIQDGLAQLRLDTKYLVFDLEATRRERDQWRDHCGRDPQ